MQRVPREMATRLLAATVFPAVVALVFGAIQFARYTVEPLLDPHQEVLTRLQALQKAMGVWNQNWYDTYVMVGGAVIALAGLYAYSRLLLPETPRTGLKHGLLALSRYFAFGFAIYLLGIAGAFRLFRLLYPGGFTAFRLIAGLLWIPLGYMMLHRLWILSEVVEAVREDRAVVADDSESIGIGTPSR